MPIIPATQEAETRRITVWGQPEQNVNETPISNNKPCMVSHKTISKRTKSEASPRQKNAISYVKNNQSKKGLGAWLKWQSAYLASLRPLVQAPVPPPKRNKPHFYYSCDNFNNPEQSSHSLIRFWLKNQVLYRRHL
jgi:hypothetical protein